jgi:hypothetical protein
MRFKLKSGPRSHMMCLEPKHVLAFLVSLVDVSIRVFLYTENKVNLPNRAMQA